MARTITMIMLLCLINVTLTAQKAVKTHEGEQIGGIKQWIGAVSSDDSKPVLLFLHGGPGFSSRAYSKKFIKYLKNDFIVAQWDQRGSGITAAWNPTAAAPTLAMLHSDTQEVIDYLLKKFNKEKLYLVGFSWGGFLGLHYANQHPEKLHAYISVSAMINGNQSERETLELLRKSAEDENNEDAIEELSKIEVPFQSWQQLYYQRKWSAYFSGVQASKKTYPKKLFEQWSDQWMSVFLEASATNYNESVTVLNCPVYFFLSDKDLVANYQVSQQFYAQLNAEQKALVWFSESTHEIPSQEPKKFSEELIKIAERERK